MKTFQIFLQNGNVARVVAAKLERSSSPDLLQLGTPVFVFSDAAGEVVAEFRIGEVSGITIEITSPTKNVI